MHLYRNGFAVLLLAIATLPTAALADNSGWYVAVDGGQSHFSDVSRQVPQWLADLPNPPNLQIGINNISDTSNDDHHAAYRFMVGYQINPYWGVEASYVDLGKATATGIANGFYQPSCQAGGFCLPITGLTAFGYRASYSDRGPGIAFTGTYPISDQWSVFARVGMIDARVKLDLETSSIPEPYATITPAGSSRSSTGWSDTFGLGVNCALNDHWAVRLDWDRYASLGSRNSTGSSNVNLASLGLVYHI